MNRNATITDKMNSEHVLHEYESLDVSYQIAVPPEFL